MAALHARSRPARSRRLLVMLAVTGLWTSVGLTAGPTALAVHDRAFELDANQTVGAGVDWQSLFSSTGTQVATLPTGFVATGFKKDFTAGSTADSSTYATGSKDTLSISPGWQCQASNNVTDKGDIVNAYSTAFRDPSSGALILYFGVEKSSPNGSSNIATWFLKDRNATCVAGTGNTPFTGDHSDGDLLLVSAFSNGGATATVNAYRWNGNDTTGSLGTTALATGKECENSNAGDVACATVNKTATVSPIWPYQDKDGGALNTFEFFEGGVNLTALQNEQCFTTFVSNTRSAPSLGSTLYDFAAGSLPVCGELKVNKYIDADLSGTNNVGDRNATSSDANSTDIAGYTFTVSGPAPSTAVKCTGITNIEGALVCSTGSLSNLAPGDYTITETQKTGFFNTDAGDGTAPAEVNTGATVSKVVTVGVGGGTVEFGNTCYVAKTFQINSVPTGAAAPTSVTVSYSVNNGAAQTLALAPKAGDATKWVGTVSSLIQTDRIAWTWYINGDSANSVIGEPDKSLAAGAYPTCTVTNQSTLESTTIRGFKYKDADNNGDFTAGTDLNGFGFRFQLLDSAGTVLQTATSGANGVYTFPSDVPPGTYTVREVAETGWVQTEPATGNRTVTVTLNQETAVVEDFGNTPLSDIAVSFINQAVTPGTGLPATTGTITCTGDPGSQTGNTYSASDLRVGEYTCKVVIVDP